MNDEALIWQIHDTTPLLHTPVFDVLAQRETAPGGLSGDYIAVQAPDWVMVIPVLGEDFLLVRQWRHGAQRLTTEFPGGVCDGDEDPALAAARELREETGFRAGRLTHLGSVSPNAALFANTFHCYLAEDLIPEGPQALDADELLTCQRRPIREVLSAYGTPEYSHALMGTALMFYMRKTTP